jgi:hypothetical protein
MINPDDVTNYNRTKYEKEEFLLFCCCVAGKSAFQQAEKLDKFLDLLVKSYYRELTYDSSILAINPDSPFALLRLHDIETVKNYLKDVKMGQYDRLTNLFLGLALVVDVDTVTVEELESFKGVGPKTARFFVVHTRPNERYIVLDTHILAYLREEGFDTPKSTPTGNTYKNIENLALALVDSSGMTPADWDLSIWKSRRRSLPKK